MVKLNYFSQAEELQILDKLLHVANPCLTSSGTILFPAYKVVKFTNKVFCSKPACEIRLIILKSSHFLLLLSSISIVTVVKKSCGHFSLLQITSPKYPNSFAPSWQRVQIKTGINCLSIYLSIFLVFYNCSFIFYLQQAECWSVIQIVQNASISLHDVLVFPV